MLKQLIEVLNNSGLALSAEEIADSLWLARHLDRHPLPQIQARTEVSPSLPSIGGDGPPTDSAVVGKPPLESSSIPSQNVPIYTHQMQKSTPDIEGMTFHSPAAAALPGSLELARAMRPLARRVPSRTQFALDEEATVKRIADEKNWIPALHPVPARWLDVVLIVDEASSMVLWQQTIAELRRLLMWHGAFRNVQVWGLTFDANTGKLHLHIGTGSEAAQKVSREPQELIDPRGERLILLLSDCISREWYDGSMARLLAIWGQYLPVAIVQMLPQRLWERTGLGNAVPVRLRALKPGMPNVQLSIDNAFPLDWSDELPSDTLPMPVITLESRSLMPWAKCLAGGGVWIPGVLLPTTSPEVEVPPAPQSMSELSPEKRVQLFRATASPLAWQLAGYLSVAPLILPVMRLVQQAMLPESRQVHLAEVFLSGLLERQTADVFSMHPDDIQYEFIPGVRDVLARTILISETLDVLATVSKFIGQRLGQPFDFLAWLVDPNVVGQFPIRDGEIPFATVTAAALHRLGGQYAQLAAQFNKSDSVLTAFAQETPENVWSATIPAPPSSAPVAFAGDILVAAGSSEQVAVLELRALADGQIRWQQTFDHILITGLVAVGDKLLLSLTSTDLLRGQGALVALDAAGAEVWRWAGGVQQVSAPTVVGNTAYLTADGRYLIAVSVTTGAEQVRCALPVAAALAAPTVVGETLYIPCRGPHLLAYTLSGEMRWRLDASLPENTWLHHTPLLCQDTVFFASSTGEILAIQAETGTPFDSAHGWLRWQAQIGPAGQPLSAPAADGERLYIGARDGLHALTLDGHPAWRFLAPQKITAAPVVVGGVVYAACWDHHLYALDAATGRELWHYTAARHIETSPLVLTIDDRSPSIEESAVVGSHIYTVIVDAGGTVNVLTHSFNAIELEAAGHLELAALQHEAAGRWERAVELWKQLGQSLRQAEALQQHARSLTNEEVQAALWEQAAALYTEHRQPALAEHCRREVARCLRQPDIALEIEHTGLVLNEWTMVQFSVYNAGFGPAYSLVIHTDKQFFMGQVAQTQPLITLDAGARKVHTMDLKPLESGDSVPLRVTVYFTDHAGKSLTCEQTIHLPVAREVGARAVRTRTQVLRAASRFVDLEIRIFPRAERGYPVEITLAGQQHFAGAIQADLAAWMPSADPVADGRYLFAALTADPGLAHAWARCRGQAPQRRVRLWLDVAAPELHALPWEMLCEDDLPLAASSATPFSRYLPTVEAWGNAVTTRPVRMLVAIANPTDLKEYSLTPLDSIQEQAVITAAFGGADDVQMDFLDLPITLAGLEERLRSGYQLLHLVGHGAFSARRQQAALYLQDTTGKVQLVTDAQFAAMLARQGVRPRLVMLVTCHSATWATTYAWHGLAPTLVQAGIPAVIVVQGAIPLATAQTFTGTFYRALAEHGTVDLALNQARGLLISQGRLDVALPVLVTRLRDGQLF